MPPRSEATTEFVRVLNAVSSPPTQTARYRRNMSVTPTVAQETLVSCFHRSHQLLPGSNAVSVYPHLFGLPATRKVDSSNKTHIPAISGVAANGSSVVGKIATTTKMMRWHLLMVGITFCLDRAVHAPHGADACSTNSSFVDTFHVDPWNSRDNVGQRVQRGVRRNRWIQNTLCTTTQTCNSVRSSEVESKAGIVLETDYSRVGRAEHEITISSGVCCRFGSGPASSWWKSISDVSLEMER